MAVQFPNNDQVPGLTFAGYQGLGAGISGGVRSLADALEKRRDEAKRLNAAGKAAKAFLKATGEDPLETERMSFDQAIATMTGKQAKQGHDLAVAQMERLLAATAQDEEEQANADRYPEYAKRLAAASQPSVSQLQDFYEGGPGVGGAMPEEAMRPTSRTPNARDFMEALAESNYRPGPSDVRLLEAMGQGGQVQPPVTSELPGGQIGYGFPGTKVRGVYPDMSKALQTQQVQDSAGNWHTMIVPPKGAPQQVREPGQITPEVRVEALTARHNALIARRKYDEAGKVWEQIQALLGTDEGPPATGAAPEANELAKPITKAAYDKLPSGTPYIDPTGVKRIKK
jgi:hypothetical protein